MAKPRQEIPKLVRQIILEMERLHPLGYSRAIKFLLDLSGTARNDLQSMLTAQIRRTRTDSTLHDFTMPVLETQSGITFMFGSGERLTEMRRRLPAYCQLKKYQLKANTWIGVGIDVENPRLLDCLITVVERWQEDAELAGAVSRHLQPLDHTLITPQEIKQRIAQLSKDG